MEYVVIVFVVGAQVASVRCKKRVDDTFGIHPQDDQFLSRELWDLTNTPADRRPLLLHYHPLVIYRFQVLKQADVVLEEVGRYNPDAVVCVGVPFGHTRPQWVLPHGGVMTVDGVEKRVWAEYC